MTTMITVEAHPAPPNASVTVVVTPTNGTEDLPNTYILAPGATGTFFITDVVSIQITETPAFVYLPTPAAAPEPPPASA